MIIKSVQKYEIFYPYFDKDKKEKLSEIVGFSEGELYPIFEEKINITAPPLEQLCYKTIDDQGVERLVSHHYFKPQIIETTYKWKEDDPTWNDLREKMAIFSDIRLTAENIIENGGRLNWSGLPDAIFGLDFAYNKLIQEIEDYHVLCNTETNYDISMSFCAKKHIIKVEEHLKELKKIIQLQIEMK